MKLILILAGILVAWKLLRRKKKATYTTPGGPTWDLFSDILNRFR